MPRRGENQPEQAVVAYRAVDYGALLGGPDSLAAEPATAPVPAVQPVDPHQQMRESLSSMLDEDSMSHIAAVARRRAAADIASIERDAQLRALDNPFGILGQIGSGQSADIASGRLAIEGRQSAYPTTPQPVPSPESWRDRVKIDGRMLRVLGGLTVVSAIIVAAPAVASNYSDYRADRTAAQLRADIQNHPDILASSLSCQTDQLSKMAEVSFKSNFEMALPIPLINKKNTKQTVQGVVSGPGLRNNSTVTLSGCGVPGAKSGESIVLAHFDRDARQYVVNRAAVQLVAAEFKKEDCIATAAPEDDQLCFVGSGNIISYNGKPISDKEYGLNAKDAKVISARNYVGIDNKTKKPVNATERAKYEATTIAKANAVILLALNDDKSCTNLEKSVDSAVSGIVSNTLSKQKDLDNKELRFTGAYGNSVAKNYAAKTEVKPLIANKSIYIANAQDTSPVSECAVASISNEENK